MNESFMVIECHRYHAICCSTNNGHGHSIGPGGVSWNACTMGSIQQTCWYLVVLIMHWQRYAEIDKIRTKFGLKLSCWGLRLRLPSCPSFIPQQRRLDHFLYNWPEAQSQSTVLLCFLFVWCQLQKQHFTALAHSVFANNRLGCQSANFESLCQTICNLQTTSDTASVYGSGASAHSIAPESPAASPGWIMSDQQTQNFRVYIVFVMRIFMKTPFTIFFYYKVDL